MGKPKAKCEMCRDEGKKVTATRIHHGRSGLVTFRLCDGHYKKFVEGIKAEP